jgi:hypothetical protein
MFVASRNAQPIAEVFNTANQSRKSWNFCVAPITVDDVARKCEELGLVLKWK